MKANTKIASTKLPIESIGKTEGAQPLENRHVCTPEVKKHTLVGIDEIQCMIVAPWTSIKMHGHQQQWEVWARPSDKTAYVCLIGEEHELVNNSRNMMVIMAIKGNVDYSYEELEMVFQKWGFFVTHGSLVVDD